MTGISQETFSLQEAINYGLENRNEIDLYNLDLRKAELDIKEYYAIGLPKVSATSEYQHFIEIPTSFVPAEFFGGPAGTFAELQFGLKNTLTAGLGFNTLIFDGSFFTGIQAQKLYRKLTKKSVNQTNYEIIQGVTESYIGVLASSDNIAILQKNIDNLENALKETRALYENGFIEKLDVDRLELSYDNLVSQKQSLERIQLLTKNVLKFQMNYPLEKEINLSLTLDDIVDKIIVEEVVLDEKTDYSKRPEYATISIGQELNEINYKATKKQRYPTLVGYGNYQYQLQRNNLFESDEPGFFPVSVVGLQLNVPIYSGGSVAIKEQQVKLDIERTEIQKATFEKGVDLQINNAYQQYLNAKQNVFSSKRRQSLAEDIYNVTKIKYKEGVGSSLEINTAERELYTTQQQYIQALLDLVNSRIALDIATGEITQNKY
jgi:outer membrane protein TolC